jgi:hypothetical protein
MPDKTKTMRYFIDTEFIEGFHKPLFGKRRHFIDLISIGIVAEDGREYYAISNEYKYSDASDWVKENVIQPMYREECPGFKQQYMDVETFHKYSSNSKSNKQIAQDIKKFICNYSQYINCIGSGSIDEGYEGFLKKNPPEFYGYFCDYDWVLFCSLFGRMINLPKGYPMYCKDLKQVLDFKAFKKAKDFCTRKHHVLMDNDWVKHALAGIKNMPAYPKQENEHNALSDARWNYELFKFLKTI